MRNLLAIFVLIMICASCAARAEMVLANPEESKTPYSPENDPKYKNANRVLMVLKQLDIKHPYLTDTAYYLDEKIEGDYFYFTDQEVGGMQVQLRYDIDGFHSENLQLNITEKGSNYNLTGSSEGVIFRYRMEF